MITSTSIKSEVTTVSVTTLSLEEIKFAIQRYTEIKDGIITFNIDNCYGELASCDITVTDYQVSIEET